VIIYAWVNNENTLRKDGDKNDPYVMFAKGLNKGDPPTDLPELLKRCIEVKASSERKESKPNLGDDDAQEFHDHSRLDRQMKEAAGDGGDFFAGEDDADQI
jgi:hypothetical protein